MRERAMGGEFTIRKSDGMKVDHEKRPMGRQLTLRRKGLG